MGTIITFYSYKGGVGRSMALANIAFELGKRGKKVLIIDWDLEAPGIERYFSTFQSKKREEGLLFLLNALANNKSPNYREFVWEIKIMPEKYVYLLPSGREKDPHSYSKILQKFDWNTFFSENNGGLHLENLRNQWKDEYDYVLIDSRTGLSDASGICTILLPDILIPMFTANYQSLFGIRDTVNFIHNARQKLDVDRIALTVLPIPSRFGTRVEFKESQEWLVRIEDILADSFNDWLPKWIKPINILEKIKIPQIDYFTFGEKLAVIEQGTNDPEGMGFIFSQISSLLISEFSDIRSFIGQDFYDSLERDYLNTNSKETQEKVEYDVFLSYPRELYPWVKDLFVPSLNEYLYEQLGHYPLIYSDEDELVIGKEIDKQMNKAIEKSKTYLLIFAEDFNYKQRQYSHYEIKRLLDEEEHQGRTMIFPIFFNLIARNNSGTLINQSLASDFDLLRNKNLLDLSSFQYEDTLKSTKVRSKFGFEIEQLSKKIAKSISTYNNRLISKTKNSQGSEYSQLISLAKEYEEIRRTMPSGSDRTRVMEKLFQKMKSNVTEPPIYFQELIQSESPGERLAAIATLHKFPNAHYIDWLSERIGFKEKPFIGYQASIALFIASRSFGKEGSIGLKVSLEKAMSNILKSSYKDPNQIVNIRSAQENLGESKK